MLALAAWLSLCNPPAAAVIQRPAPVAPARRIVALEHRTGLTRALVEVQRALIAAGVRAAPSAPAASSASRPPEAQREELAAIFEGPYQPIGGAVGVPKESKPHERRVGLTPAGVRRLREANVEVIVERGAGLGSGFSDAEYEAAGAELAGDAAELFRRADIIKKVKELQPEEFELVEPHHTIFTYNHFEEDKTLTRRSIQSRATYVSYEKVVVNGRTPLLAPMSRIAGRLGAEWAEAATAARQGPRRLVILGGGAAGESAARRALELGFSDVAITESNPARRGQLARELPGARVLDAADHAAVREALRESDAIIGAVFVGGKAPTLIGYEGQTYQDKDGREAAVPGRMAKGPVPRNRIPHSAVPFSYEDITQGGAKPKAIVDIAVDQGGNAAFVTDRAAKIVSREKTSHDRKSVRDAYGNELFRVPNMPAALPRQASLDLEEITLPYLWAMAADTVAAMMFLPELQAASSISDGIIWDAQVRAAHGLGRGLFGRLGYWLRLALGGFTGSSSRP